MTVDTAANAQHNSLEDITVIKSFKVASLLQDIQGIKGYVSLTM